MEENMKTESNALLRTSPIYPTMHNNVLQSKMKINPTDTTLFTHSNLHSVYPSDVHLTHTTMSFMVWFKLIKLNLVRIWLIGKCMTWNTTHTRGVCFFFFFKQKTAY